MERQELILKLRDLTPEQADQIAAALRPLAERNPRGKLSRIRRERHADYEMHLGREEIVR